MNEKDEKIAALAAACRDLEGRLREMEGYYRSLLAISPEIVYRLDEEGRIVHISPAVAKLGYDPEELIGKPFEDIVHPEDRIKSRSQFVERRIGERRTKNLEIRLISKGRESYPYEIKSMIFSLSTRGQWDVPDSDITRPDKRFIGTQGVASDITARKVTEAALHISEELNAKLLDAIPDFVVRTDMEGNIEFINDIGLAMSGYERREVIGANMLSFVAPQDRDRAARNYLLMSERKLGPVEYQLVMKNGVQVQFDVNGDVLRDEQGVPYGLVFVCRNIMEKKKEREDRSRLEAQLIQARKMEAIGTLAGGIAHDFNNLLMGIQGYVSLILMDMKKDHPHYEKLKAVENHVQSGADLTMQLLGFARGGRYEMKPTDLNELIQKTAVMFGRTKKEITIRERYQKDLSPVDVDRGQIEQVLLNLFLNAAQAMPGGGDILLETENVRIDDSYVAPYEIKLGPYVRLSVIDNGLGMDEATRQRIFDPFFTTKEMGRGTGLGLASVYGIIKGHGGFINVDSEKGRGSAFHIYLPASDRAVVPEEVASPRIEAGQETILLVDDEKTIVEVTREMLAEMGYRVLVAHSGPEAIGIYEAQRETIDLVILDMIMPGMGGGEVYDRLKEIDPAVRVILSSGYSMEVMAKGIMGRGVQAFLQKPFRLEQLSLKVREALK